MQLYKISFTTTPKVYIGITSKTAEIRFKEHCIAPKNKLISRAIRKHGVDNTILTILAECDDWELLCLCEVEAIEKYNSKHPNGYNLTDGGEGVLGLKHTYEQVEQNRKRNIEMWVDNDDARKLAAQKTRDHFNNNPDRRQEVSKRFKKYFESVENREACSLRTKEYYRNNPQALVDMSNKHKKLHEENPKLAIEHSIKMQEYFNKPGQKEEHSALLKKYYDEHPEKRLAMSERQKQLFIDDPNRKLKASLSTKELFENNDYRMKHSENLKNHYINNPVSRVKASLSASTSHAKKVGRALSLLPKDYFNDKT